jgi:spermidine synthase
VIGLGTGTLTVYGLPGDYYRVYEINPLVIQIANTEFSFLRHCKAKCDVVLGDARLSLEREQPQGFDVLAVDAFSGDSIPVHLLTRQAFELYFRHLKPDGVLAVHVSNKYLDLQPVVKRLAEAIHKDAIVVDTDDVENTELFGSTWVLVTSNQVFLNTPVVKDGSGEVDGRPNQRLWTDDYSNLFKILK